MTITEIELPGISGTHAVERFRDKTEQFLKAHEEGREAASRSSGVMAARSAFGYATGLRQRGINS